MLFSVNRYADDLDEGKRKKMQRVKSYIIHHKYLQFLISESLSQLAYRTEEQNKQKNKHGNCAGKVSGSSLLGILLTEKKFYEKLIEKSLV